MAKVVMKPFFAVGFLKDRAEVLESLQKLGCVELNVKLKSLNVDLESELEVKNLADSALKVKNAIDSLKSHCNFKRNLFNFKRVESLSKLEEVEKQRQFLLQQVNLINDLNFKIQQNLKSISSLKNEIKKLSYFVSFDAHIKDFETDFTRCFFCEISQKFDFKKLNSIFNDSDAYFELIHCSKFKTVVFAVVLKDNYFKLKQKLLSCKFSFVSFNFHDVTVQQRIDCCKSEIVKLEQENYNFLSDLIKKSSFINDFELLFDYLNLKLEHLKKFLNLKKTKYTFFLEGFLNPIKEAEFIKIINKFDLFFEIYNPNLNSPVDFKNCGVVAAVEDVTKTYSMPSGLDVDPNPFMAFFYYIFFGIMFSDAGYGALMVAFCSFFAFSKRIDLKNRNKFKMFFYCGVSTVFWGLMFGSFFGDCIGVFSKTFLGLNFFIKPLLVDTLNEPMKLLCFSLSLGFLQIFIGILIKFFALIKNNNFKEAFFVELGWIFLMVGSGIFCSAFFLKFNFLKLVGFYFVILGAIFIVFLSGYKSKGLIKIFSGLVNLYGVTSYVGDLLSYCRLMALAIATGVVANVVNLLSTMLCVNFFGFLAFLVVFIFGHAMNFGINALGAYVHTVRLQYVEFFSKFYEGGGRLFKPFGLGKTKFIEFVDINKMNMK